MKRTRLAAMIGVLSLLLVAVCVTAADIRIIDITVQPRTLVMESQSTWVTVHTNISFYAVDQKSVTLGEGDEEVAMAWAKSDSRGQFVAKFREGEIKEIVAPPEATLTLRGQTIAGEDFQGTDTIVVK